MSFATRALIVAVVVCCAACGSRRPLTDGPRSAFEQTVSGLKRAFPDLFLPDAAIQERGDITRPTVFGDPDPPEGFAGPDPQGALPFGIYVPSVRDGLFETDISLEQWIVHEMFHLRNRRTQEYDFYVGRAFPTDDDPLVQWLMKDPYHRAFAREEAFLNLVTFADPARTDEQRSAVRDWFNAIGASTLSLDEVQEIMRVIPHPPKP